jgi:very-long-chain (3R)-3-hydroxyacyl-CoA dehydratase
MANGAVIAYLIIYNIACCAGWLYVLSICIRHITQQSYGEAVYWDELNLPLKVVQTAAVLVVIHSLVGLVKSPWVTALMKVFSRVWTLWAVMVVAPTAQSSIFTVLACTSWSLVEVPRYLFYALNLIDAVPYFLFWLRYSLFAILYPTGITGEVGCMYLAGVYLAGKSSVSGLYMWRDTILGVEYFL